MADHNPLTLDELEIGECAIIDRVGGSGALRQHFLDMGVIPGAQISFVKYAPMGDPMQFLIHGYELTLRSADAAQIAIHRPSAQEARSHESRFTPVPDSREDTLEHPGLGEGGRYHASDPHDPLPEGTLLTFALAGNQNCGKTTLFNCLTGSNQHVGNFPGVTVDRKDGPIKGHPATDVVDLPGIYSMSPYSAEELVSRQYILEEKPRAIINIVDATNIERNLYLSMQLMELDIPMVLALNMMDEMQGNGGYVRINEMERLLGIPVVPISAVSGSGVDELISHALHIARYQEYAGIKDFCDAQDQGGAVHRCLHSIMHLIEDHAARAEIPVRFAATKLVEGDQRIFDALKLDKNEQEAIEHIVHQMEQERGLDRAAAIADMRFSFIARVVSHTVVKPHRSKERERSRAIDRVLTGKYTAIPSFVGIMALVFWLTFNVIGAYFQQLLAGGIAWLTAVTDQALTSADVAGPLHSLVIDGVFTGVGTVISFVPIIIVLFFLLSLLEDSGYMARVAFVMDKLLRKIGLSGRSIVPLLIGFGCTVPAVMSTRTLPSARDRKLTIILTPFMSCSTKITIYSFLTAAFFPGHGALIMVGLYFTGILVGVLTALIGRKNLFRGEAVPFVMELPNYRMPSLSGVCRLAWDKTKDFLQRAFTIIFLATIIVWFLQTFDFHFAMVSDPGQSMLADCAGAIAPIFAPLGFGDWRITTALIAGFLTKETVVSTLSILFSGAALLQAITPLSALSLLVFCLLYTPCIAAIAAIVRELGGKWATAIVVFQCTIAWLVAFLVRMAGLALGFC